MGNVASIILNYNTWEDTLKEAELVKEKAGMAWKDIIVIDNCSTNNSAYELKKVSSGRFVFLQTDENKGYASGNNVGLRYAYEKGYQYAWILNNDILFDDEKILDRLIRILEGVKQAAVVNPDICAPDGYMYNRDSVRPDFFDLTLGILSYRKKGRAIEDQGGYGYVYRPQGCCMVVDINKLNEVDFMDEHTFLYSEELILAERLLAKGYRCICCTDSQVIHNHSNTVKNNLQKKEIREIKKESFDYYLAKYRNYKFLGRKICAFFYTLKLMVTGE